jgi:diadenosine tetraphosphate (Ap4A) HIT family hydrolase
VVTDSPEQFAARARAAADDEGRLPVPPQAMWDIFPFEVDGLRTVPLQDPVLPEPARAGEDPAQCRRCADVEDGAVWSDERWVLTGAGPLGLPFGALLVPRAHLDLGDCDDQHAADLGRLTVRIDRAVRTLPHIGRVHVNKWGDGGAHLHVFFLARPAGFVQLRGSNLPLWEDLLPRVPDDVLAADLRAVAERLARDGGRVHG